MLKRLLSMVLVLALCLTLAVPAFAAEGKTTVIIHYQPAKDNTLDWNMWLWGDGKEGAAFLFNGEDAFGKVATHELNGTFAKLGLIVRTDDWDKDVAEDRFADVVDGKVEIWLVSGDAKVYTSNPQGGAVKAPAAMPKTGMGGTSEPIQSMSVIYAVVAAMALVLSGAYVVVRKKRYN
jgi:hypothetical protein